MQAVERTLIEGRDWITILFLTLLIAVFLLKAISIKRLKGHLTSIFNNNFIEFEIEENRSFFNLFQIILFAFSMLVLSFTLYKSLLVYGFILERGMFSYFKIFGLVFVYFILKWFLEYLLSFLFLIHTQVKFFLISKHSYLYAITFILSMSLILVEYSQLTSYFLVYLCAFLFLIRFLAHVFSNKNLILNQLFYFILYLCAFEIAPLFILFKLMF